jgi:hypothetical protein
MHTYERPVFTAAGSFDKVTALSIFGPRETLVQYQLFLSMQVRSGVLFLASFGSARSRHHVKLAPSRGGYCHCD